MLLGILLSMEGADLVLPFRVIRENHWRSFILGYALTMRLPAKSSRRTTQKLRRDGLRSIVPWLFLGNSDSFSFCLINEDGLVAGIPVTSFVIVLEEKAESQATCRDPELIVFD